MRVLITRPLVDAQRTAEPLRERGVEAVIEPLFSISTIPAAAVRLDGVQGFLVTSANGARALADTVPKDAPIAFAMPVYAVGDTSATVARERGFSQVLSADGDVAALAALVRRKAKPDAGALVHAAGTEVAGDLGGDLAADGFEVRRERLYETRQAVALSRETREMLASQKIHAAFFYSPRTAKIFVELARKAKVTDACRTITAYCLSQAVAEDARQVPFTRVRVAEEPTQDALLSLFDADRAAGAFADAEGGPEMTDRPNKDAKEPEEKTKAEAAKAPEGTTAGPAKGGGTPQNAKGKGKDDPKDKDKPAAASAAGPGGSDKDKEKDTGGAKSGSVPAGGSTARSGPAGPGPQTGAGGKPPTSTGSTGSGPGDPNNGGRPAGSTPPKKQGHPVRNGAIIAGVVIVAAAVAYGSMPYWRDNVPEAYQGFLPPYPEADTRLTEMQAENQQLQSQVQDLQNRLAALGDQIGSLEGQVAEVADQPAGPELPADLTQRLTQMEEQLQTLSGLDPQALETVVQAGEGARQEIQALRQEFEEVRRGTADASTVLSMQERLDRVAEMARQTASRQDTALALLLTTAQLRQAVDQGQPYEAELRTVRAIADEMPRVDLQPGILAEHAETGIPTRPMLNERFQGLASEIITAAAAPDDAPAWVQKTVQRAMSLVTVRRTDGEAVGNDASAVVARTSSALEAGDLREAVNELQKLEGEAAEVAQPWIADAQARLQADDVIADMGSEALARFGATQKTGAGAGSGSGGAAGEAAASPATGTEG